MRTISKKEIAQLRVSGSKVKQLTEAAVAKQKVDVIDHRPQLADIEKRLGEGRARTEEVALEASAEMSQQRKVLDQLGMDLHQLRDELESKQHPPQMEIQRNQFTGFIDSVTVGGLVFKFNRNNVQSVKTIDILKR